MTFHPLSAVLQIEVATDMNHTSCFTLQLELCASSVSHLAHFQTVPLIHNVLFFPIVEDALPKAAHFEGQCEIH